VKLSELRRITDAMAPELVVVPKDAEDVCPICRSWRNPTGKLCNNCDQAFRDLSSPCRFVIPISLYAKPSPMRDRLKYYKDPVESSHARYPAELSAIIERFFYEHDAVRGISAAFLDPPELLLVRGLGPLGHRVLSDNGYVPTVDVRRRRLLLVDDVYTTGARSQSAASALTLAGAEVVAVVAIGRRVNPSWKPDVQAVWDRQAALTYNFEEPPWWAS